MAKTLKQQIRKIIKEHYKEDLWIFRDDVSYNMATQPFVDDLAKVIRGKNYEKDCQCGLSKYYSPGYSAIRIGGRLRFTRIMRDLSLEAAAKNFNVHPAFLAEFENGQLISDLKTTLNIRDVLKMDKSEKTYLYDALDQEPTLEERIVDVIDLYYRKNLWIFRPQYPYEKSIRPFVRDLAGLAGGGKAAMLPNPIKPISDLELSDEVIEKALEELENRNTAKHACCRP